MKFTIRDLLWLTVVVALGVAWGLDRVLLARSASHWEIQAAFARSELRRFGWKVTDDFQSYPEDKNAVWPMGR
jgi:hypothetical protein